jgi:tRNA 2-thiocytidine biosynthesis protein TtcA
LQEWEREFPGRVETIFTALRNVVPSHLADTNAFDFAGLSNTSAIADKKMLAELSGEEWLEQEISAS